MRKKLAQEKSFSGRASWLRAGVLGASDGLVSTSSLLAGVSATAVDQHTLVITGIASIVAGSCSMAVGEYVSVSTQRESEAADLSRQEHKLEHEGAAGKAAAITELAQSYQAKGLPADLAHAVATTLTEHSTAPAEVHAREKHGVEGEQLASPVQAAMSSLAAFTVGGSAPLMAAALAPPDPGSRSAAIFLVTLGMLAVTGMLSSKLGGVPVARGARRVVIGGCLAMAVTHVVGSFFGVDTS